MHQRRHRQRQYPLANQKRRVRVARLVSIALLILVVLFAGKKLLNFFGVGNPQRQTAALLTLEDRGVINVSVDGGPLKRAEDGIKLYAGDSIVSSPNNFATLTFFEETTLRLDESTQVEITESEHGEESSTLTLLLEEGSLWLAAPTKDVFSGAIVRRVESAYLRIDIPSQSEVVMSPQSLAVFSADGLGITVTIAGSDQQVIVGEGQQFTLPLDGVDASDLYVYRDPLDPSQVRSSFVEESRARHLGKKHVVVTPEGTEVIKSDAPLTVLKPDEGSEVQSSTVNVSGTIGEGITKVRINGYIASVDVENGTFAQELTLPDVDEVDISIEAVDANNIVVAQELRTVKRNRKPPEAPTITSPAAASEVFTTSEREVEISGTAPDGAIGILVNDYRLQLFSPGDTEWTYLARTDFNNYKFGENIYEITAINRGGYKSDPAVITIVLGVTEEGATNEGTKGREGTESNVSGINIPLNPGSIKITGPTDGSEYTTNENEFLIEGTVPEGTHTVWINNYQLRLFEPQKGFFNYIGSTDLNTLKRGRNSYSIILRNEEGLIIDEFEYIVNFAPSRS